jgi:hypothetical protein
LRFEVEVGLVGLEDDFAAVQGMKTVDVRANYWAGDRAVSDD